MNNAFEEIRRLRVGIQKGHIQVECFDEDLEIAVRSHNAGLISDKQFIYAMDQAITRYKKRARNIDILNAFVIDDGV